LKYQKDFIAALVETRKTTEVYQAKLTKRQEVTVKPDIVKEYKRSLTAYQRLGTWVKQHLGVGADEDGAPDVPSVFCYSLFYVYYDQYTYITGVLA